MSAIKKHCIWTALLLLFTAFFLPGQSLAQDSASPADPADRGRTQIAPVMPGGGQQLVSIDFNNVDIGVFIKFISDLTKKNFVIDDRVKGKVSIISPGKITVAEAYKVFESVLEVNGYAAVPAGEIIKIISAPEARTKNIRTRLEEEAGPTNDSVVTQIIPLRYASPEEIKRLFTPLVSKNSVILSYEPTNTLIITDVQSNINRLLHILKAIDITGVGQQIAIIPVEYADATKLVSLLNSIFKGSRRSNGRQSSGDDVTFVADERTNSIVMLASEAQAESIRELVISLDKETPKGQAKIHVYYLEHASAEDLEKVLEGIPDKSAGGKSEGGKQTAPVVSDKVRITADKATNSLIITADQEDYVTLEAIIRKIDIPRSMVYIESLIMEVDVNKDLNLGSELMMGSETSYKNQNMIYGGGFSPNESTAYGDSAGIIAGGLPPTGFSMGIFGEGITVGNITFPSISALIKAFKKDHYAQVLSTPQILTTDNQEAKVYVGENRAFQTQAGVATSTSATAYNSYEYKDVGKTLKITPQISKDRMVRLEISLESTSISGTVVDNRPTTLKRTIDTTAIVKDGHTIVLGGLIDESSTTTDSRVPCLGDIPGLGWLFRSVGKNRYKTNLYIFLTPRVIQSPEEADNVSSSKRSDIDRLREKKINLYDKTPQSDESPPPIPEGTTPAPQSESNGGQDDLAPAATRPASLEHSPGQATEPVSTEMKTDKSSQTQDEAPAPMTGTGEQTSPPPEDQSATGLSKDAPPANAVSNRATEADSKGYTIQVVSTKSSEAADKFLQELMTHGYAAYIVRTEVNGTIWYRLRIGYYDKLEAAQQVMQQLRAKQYNPILISL